MSSGCIDFETGISFIVRCLFRHLVARHGSSLARGSLAHLARNRHNYATMRELHAGSCCC